MQQNIHAVAFRHHQIKQHCADFFGFRAVENLDGGETALGCHGLQPETLDHFFKDAPLRRIVFNDKNVLLHYPQLTMTVLCGENPWRFPPTRKLDHRLKA